MKRPRSQSVTRALCFKYYSICAPDSEGSIRNPTALEQCHAILRSLAFKWVRILWRCWKEKVPYDDTRYLSALAKRRSPLATAA